MPEVGGVVHTHSTYAVAWAARGEEIPCVITAMADEFGGPIPIGPFAIIGDDSIGRGIVETLTGHRSRAVLMQNHGPFTIGVAAKDAVKAAVMVEDVARTVHYRPRGRAAHPDPAGGDRPPLRPLPERLRPERGRAAMSGSESDADAREAILAGRTSLGIELGSTRIKACLVAATTRRPCSPSAATSGRTSSSTGSGPIRSMPSGRGCRPRTPTSSPMSQQRHGVTPETFGAIGVSAMMHGYLAFDADGELLVPFRTWRNTTTGPAAAELTELFGVNIPLRWSIAHLYQAVLDDEPHVPEVRLRHDPRRVRALAAHRPQGARRRRRVGHVPDRLRDERLRRASCSRGTTGSSPSRRPRSTSPSCCPRCSSPGSRRAS